VCTRRNRDPKATRAFVILDSRVVGAGRDVFEIELAAASERRFVALARGAERTLTERRDFRATPDRAGDRSDLPDAEGNVGAAEIRRGNRLLGVLHVVVQRNVAIV